MISSWVRTFVWLFLGCWLLVSLAALAGMYNLWWQRERVLYLGKSVQQQREVVFQRAGFPPSFVEKIDLLERQWPQFVHYLAKGDLTTSLSYVKYLLIPRIPSGEGSYVITAKGDDWSVIGESNRQLSNVAHPPDTRNPAVFFLSLFFLTGFGFLMRKFWGSSLSWPEALGLSCFFLTLLVLPIRFFTFSAIPAFWGTLVIGLAGWISMFFSAFRKRVPPGSLKKAVVCWSFVDEKKIQEKDWILGGVLVTVIVLALLWSLIMSVIVVPDDWDAWAIWGSKAKELALGNGPLHDVTWFGHADYPLLWPVIWAFTGWLSGGWEEYWSRGWGTIFLFLCVWEIICIVRSQSKSLTAGLLAGALFVSMPNVPLLASWSYAEAPLWLMMTCGLARFLRWQDKGNIRDVLLAALFAAAAAYTKNEGVLFALLLGCMLVMSGRRRFQAIMLYSIIFLSCYALWFYWSRIYYDLGSHATDGLHPGRTILQRAVQRAPSAVDAVSHMWGDIRQWSIVGCGMALSLIGVFFQRECNGIKKHFLLLPVGLLTGYFVIILFHAAEVYWQVGTAWNRLTVQSLPLFMVLLVPMYWRLLRGKDN